MTRERVRSIPGHTDGSGGTAGAHAFTSLSFHAPISASHAPSRAARRPSVGMPAKAPVAMSSWSRCAVSPIAVNGVGRRSTAPSAAKTTR